MSRIPVAPLPFPPKEYNQQYFNELIRTLNLYFRLIQNTPGIVTNSIQFVPLPIDPGVLPEGGVWFDPVAQVVRMVDSTYVKVGITGQTMTSAAGTVTP